MESGFDPRCPVLDCGATWKPDRYRRPLMTMLWPAYEYQVVLPEPRERKINIFQKHIIGLTLAGVTSAELIGRYLNLDPDLAAFILLELRGMGMLDDDYELTQAGQRIIDEERQSQEPKMTVGRVYQDPWTGKLWPRFLSENRAARLDAVFLEEGRVRLRQGTVGNSHIRDAIVVRPDDDARPRKLEPREVFQAWIEHQNARIEYEQIRRGRLDDDDDKDDDLAGVVAETWVDRIAQIGAEPMPVWLTTYAFVPQEVTRGAYWRACDPFGLGPSDEMSERIDGLRDRDPLLRSEIAKITGQDLNADYVNINQMMALIHAEATRRVEDELTVAIRNYERLFRAAIHMESLLTEAAHMEPSLRGLRLMEVVNRAQVVLELIFDELRRVHRTDRCWEDQGLLDNGMEHNAAVFRAIAKKLGFEKPPDTIVFVRLGKIIRAAKHGDQSINPRLLAALLAAHRDRTHPLWSAARVLPDMLARIARVAELRNEAGGAHAGTGDVALELEQVQDAVKSVYRIVRTLLPETRESRVQPS